MEFTLKQYVIAGSLVNELMSMNAERRNAASMT